MIFVKVTKCRRFIVHTSGTPEIKKYQARNNYAKWGYQVCQPLVFS